jgi:hypothetical protein
MLFSFEATSLRFPIFIFWVLMKTLKLIQKSPIKLALIGRPTPFKPWISVDATELRVKLTRRVQPIKLRQFTLIQGLKGVVQYMFFWLKALPPIFFVRKYCTSHRKSVLNALCGRYRTRNFAESGSLNRDWRVQSRILTDRAYSRVHARRLPRRRRACRLQILHGRLQHQRASAHDRFFVDLLPYIDKLAGSFTTKKYIRTLLPSYNVVLYVVRVRVV